MRGSRLLLALGLIFLGVVSRLLPHLPNFTAINAVALLGVFSLGSASLALFSSFTALLVCDLLLGFHSTMPFVYLSIGLITFIGLFLKNSKAFTSLLLASFASSLLFFIVTNFGVWSTTTFYPKTWEGLCACYLAALPFFSHQLLGDFAYSTLLLTIYFVKNTTFRKNALCNP